MKIKTDLMPTIDNMYDKSVFLGFTPDLIQAICNQYILKNQHWFYDRSKYREVAFLSNYQHLLEVQQHWFVMHIRRNNFVYFTANQDLKDLNQINMYENVFIDFKFFETFFEDFDFTSVKKVVEKIVSNNSKIYYLTPEIIYKTDNNVVYNQDSLPNTDLNNKKISQILFYDQYMQYLKNTHKFPIYRVIIPDYFQDVTYNTLIQADISRVVTRPKKLRDEIKKIMRPTMNSQKLAEALYLIHIDSKPQNYCITGDIYFSVADYISKKSTIRKSDNMQKIQFDNSFLSNCGFENYSYEIYKEKIKRTVNKEVFLRKYDWITYYRKISSYANKEIID